MQFEWSESGLECLRKIQNEIEQGGGIIAYHEKAFQEVYNDNLYLMTTHTQRSKMRMCIKYRVSPNDACSLLNISKNDYDRLRSETIRVDRLLLSAADL